MENYLVLLSREIDVPVPTLAPALAKVLARPAVEITRQLREQPWILLSDVPADALDDVFEVLVQQEVPAKALPAIHMPELPRPLRLKYGEPMPKGLFLQRAAPPAPAVLPWPDIRIVSAGQITVKPDESIGADHMLSTPGSATFGRGRRREEQHLLVDLICRGEEPLRLRIDGKDFNYDYLGERMLSSSRENLRLLLGDIRSRAPDAHYTSRTESLISDRPAPEFRFRSLAAFEALNLWALQTVTEAELEAGP